MPAPRPTTALAAAALWLAVAFAASALTGCTNSQPALAKNPHTGTATASAVAGMQQVVVHTGPDLRFHPSTIVVHQGRVRVILKNKSGGGPPHDLEVHGLPGAFVPLTQAGDVGQVTFDAPSPGRYRFVCTIHVQEGQTGTLIVRAGS